MDVMYIVIITLQEDSSTCDDRNSVVEIAIIKVGLGLVKHINKVFKPQHYNFHSGDNWQ